MAYCETYKINKWRKSEENGKNRAISKEKYKNTNTKTVLRQILWWRKGRKKN